MSISFNSEWVSKCIRKRNLRGWQTWWGPCPWCRGSRWPRGSSWSPLSSPPAVKKKSPPCCCRTFKTFKIIESQKTSMASTVKGHFTRWVCKQYYREIRKIERTKLPKLHICFIKIIYQLLILIKIMKRSEFNQKQIKNSCNFSLLSSFYQGLFSCPFYVKVAWSFITDFRKQVKPLTKSCFRML